MKVDQVPFAWGSRLLAALLLVASISFAQAPALTTIYSFGGVTPSPIVVGPGGVLYGTQFSSGIVYSLTPPTSPGGAWTPTTLTNILSLGPKGPLVLDRDGVLYGTTQTKGLFTGCLMQHTCGTVFELAPPASSGGAWKLRLLHVFTDENGAGWGPTSGVAIGPGHVLYGSTTFGNAGTIFSLAPLSSPGGSWLFSTLYSFTGRSDGSGPGELTYTPAGLLGTTGAAGLGYGTIYLLTTPAMPGGSWGFQTIYTFTGGADGGGPSNLAIGKDGGLYGTTHSGGSNGQRYGILADGANFARGLVESYNSV